LERPYRTFHISHGVDSLLSTLSTTLYLERVSEYLETGDDITEMAVAKMFIAFRNPDETAMCPDR
jgi:hypothetical protein